MNSNSQCHAILATFGKRWFTNAVAWDHLRITSLQGCMIERKWHPEHTHKVYRVAGRIKAA